MDSDSGHPGRPRVVAPLASTRLKTPPPRPSPTATHSDRGGAATADARALLSPPGEMVHLGTWLCRGRPLLQAALALRGHGLSVEGHPGLPFPGQLPTGSGPRQAPLCARSPARSSLGLRVGDEHLFSGRSSPRSNQPKWWHARVGMPCASCVAPSVVAPGLPNQPRAATPVTTPSPSIIRVVGGTFPLEPRRPERWSARPRAGPEGTAWSSGPGCAP